MRNTVMVLRIYDTVIRINSIIYLNRSSMGREIECGNIKVAIIKLHNCCVDVIVR